MSILDSTQLTLMRAISGATLRNTVLSNNIANADTPGFQPSDVDFTYHDASASLGHDIELHVDSDGLRGFFAMFESAAADWDGSTDLLRPALG